MWTAMDLVLCCSVSSLTFAKSGLNFTPYIFSTLTICYNLLPPFSFLFPSTFTCIREWQSADLSIHVVTLWAPLLPPLPAPFSPTSSIVLCLTPTSSYEDTGPPSITSPLELQTLWALWLPLYPLASPVSLHFCPSHPLSLPPMSTICISHSTPLPPPSFLTSCLPSLPTSTTSHAHSSPLGPHRHSASDFCASMAIFAFQVWTMGLILNGEAPLWSQFIQLPIICLCVTYFRLPGVGGNFCRYTN